MKHTQKEAKFPCHSSLKIEHEEPKNVHKPSFRTKCSGNTFQKKSAPRKWPLYAIKFRPCQLFLLFMCTSSIRSTSCAVGPTSAPVPEGTSYYTVSTTIKAMAQLPCNISTTLKNDSVRLVLWYKESIKGGPIYSVDSRRLPLASGRHFSALATFASRASFNVFASPAVLTIDTVDTEDAGEYKCRVDFRRGRTTVTVVTLNIIVPPTKLEIFDENGEHLAGRTQPVNEGSKLRVICQASGGYPPPSLKWHHEGVEIDASYDLDAKGNTTVTNELNLSGVERRLFRTVLTCEASSASYSYSVNSSVSIDLNLKPLCVQIVQSNKSLIAGRRVELVCESSGSRPPAVLTWIKNKRKLVQMRESISTNGNMTTSTLSFVPSIEDNGLTLVCKAENVRLPNSATIEDKLLLDVFYEPQVTLVLRAEDGVVRERETVQMECLANGRPSSLDIQWTLDDVALRSTPTEENPRFLVNNSILVIYSARREDSGKYRCLASNLVGRTHSNDLHLAVQYPPTCREGQKLVYGVGLAETARVLCDVDALPTNLTFRWTLNDSLDFELSTKYPTNSELTRSSILYTPFTRSDYGTLRCWARNTAGDQVKPCTFTVLAAGRPDVAKDCLISSFSSTKSTLDCQAGYDGGLEQRFILEVYEDLGPHPTLVDNQTSILPSFILSDLRPEATYILNIFSANIRGRSDKSVLLSLTTRPMRQLSPEEQGTNLDTEREREMWTQATVTALVIIFLLLLLGVISKFNKARTMRRIQRQRRKELSRASEDDRFFDKATAQRASYESNLTTEYEESSPNNDPDIIPSNRFPLKVMVNASELDEDAAVALYSKGFKGLLTNSSSFSPFEAEEVVAVGGVWPGAMSMVQPNGSNSPRSPAAVHFAMRPHFRSQLTIDLVDVQANNSQQISSHADNSDEMEYVSLAPYATRV